MGSVTPSGVIYVPLTRFRTLLASLSSFQTWLGVELEEGEESTLAELAAEYVYYEWTEEATQHVLLYTSGWSSESIARGRAIQALPGGFFGVKFFQPVPKSYAAAPDDALVTFLGAVADILLDAQRASGQGGDLSIHSVQLLDRALSHWADEPDDSTGFCMADFRVVYGP